MLVSCLLHCWVIDLSSCFGFLQASGAVESGVVLLNVFAVAGFTENLIA